MRKFLTFLKFGPIGNKSVNKKKYFGTFLKNRVTSKCNFWYFFYSNKFLTISINRSLKGIEKICQNWIKKVPTLKKVPIMYKSYLLFHKICFYLFTYSYISCGYKVLKVS